MTTWLTSKSNRSSKRSSTSVIGFGPKNGVQAHRLQHLPPEETLLHLPLQEKHFQSPEEELHPLSQANPCLCQESQTFSFKWLNIKAKLTKKSLSHRHANIWNRITASPGLHANATFTNPSKRHLPCSRRFFYNSQMPRWDLCSKAMPTLLHNPLDCHPVTEGDAYD